MDQLVPSFYPSLSLRVRTYTTLDAQPGSVTIQAPLTVHVCMCDKTFGKISFGDQRKRSRNLKNKSFLNRFSPIEQFLCRIKKKD